MRVARNIGLEYGHDADDADDAARAALDAQLASGDLTDLAYANKLVTLA